MSSKNIVPIACVVVILAFLAWYFIYNKSQDLSIELSETQEGNRELREEINGLNSTLEIYYEEERQRNAPTYSFPAEKDLPAEVLKTRQAMLKAAKNRSYEELAAIVKNGEPKYSFGDDYPGGFIAWLKYQDKQYPEDTSFDKILKLLNQPFAKETYSSGGSNYIWPAAFAQQDEYYDSRIYIEENGFWSMYIAGD